MFPEPANRDDSVRLSASATSSDAFSVLLLL